MAARPGDWSCPTCRTVNFASRNECRNRCSGVTRPSNAGPPAAKAGDWTCICGTNNFASRNMCFSCQKPKSTSNAPAPPPAVKSGDWTCPCGTNNFASRNQCFGCQKSKGGAAPPPPANAPVAAPANGVVNPSTTVKAGDWQCPCGTSNFSSRTACFKCTKPKPSFPATSNVPEPSSQVKAGDWICAQCTANNFASRTECYGCRQPKGSTVTQKQQPAPQQTQSSPPPSAAQAGDWPCGQCSFSNFGSRTACFKCGAQRPVPATAGGGGGAPKLNAADAAILGSFALPSYWKSDAKSAKPELVESGYFSSVATTLWSKFATATKGRKIQSVVRIENVALWHGYCAEVQRLVAKYPNQAAPIPSKWEPKSLQILNDQFHINETYLLHGTSPDVAKLIVEGGFDPSHSGESAGALFGQGTYFSDSLDKVMKYSKGCVVVSRVALGEIATPPHPGSTSSYRRPPTKKSGDEYDSLVATASHTPSLKEFIVYRHTKAYPEYLVFHD